MINEIIQGDCLDVMKRIPDGSVDLTLTSPPYDNLRMYKGYKWDFEETAKELFRVTKDGGVVVWVVGDSTVRGSETGTSFRQALYFMETGFKLHDTMIYDKGYAPFPTKNRYNQSFEYMFIMSKGKIKTYNLLGEPRTTKGNRVSTFRQSDGTTEKTLCEMGNTRVRRNIWHIDNGYMRTTKDREAFEHPAMFPEKLADDHILSWSSEGDTVLDPFGGSGTTAKMSLINGRNFISIDVSEEYCDISRRRIGEAKRNLNQGDR